MRITRTLVAAGYLLAGHLVAAGPHPPKNSNTSTDYDVPFVRNLPQNRSVIVFVHGVTGNATQTWSNGAHYWPAMLRDDTIFDGQNIYVYEYPSPIAGRSLSVDELADNMRLVLSTDGVLRHSSIIFVAHSMGGLITRAFILKYRHLVAKKIRFLYFFATPTTGSPFAFLAKLVSKNPQFGQLYPMDADVYLGTVQSAWLAADLHLKSYCAYETLPTPIGIIVERQSATNLCTERLDPIDADHISIVKPSSAQSTPYRALQSAVIETATPLKTRKDTVHKTPLQKDVSIESKREPTSEILLSADVTPSSSLQPLPSGPTVTISDRNGMPLKGVQILVVRRNGTHLTLVQSDAKGAAQLEEPITELVSVYGAGPGLEPFYWPNCSILMAWRSKWRPIRVAVP